VSGVAAAVGAALLLLPRGAAAGAAALALPLTWLFKVDRRLIGASPLIGATIGATAPSATTIGAIGAIGASQPDRRQASFLLFFQWFLHVSTDASRTGFGILCVQLVPFWRPQINVAGTDSIARFRGKQYRATGPVQQDPHLITD
jgi:hypothetical protein